jgi:guanyl-specific ribonuclease Sa
VIDPPPQEIFNEAINALAAVSREEKSNITELPFKDIPSRTPDTPSAASPKVTLQLRATSVKMADLVAAKDDILKQISDCGPMRRRAVAFIRPEAVEKRLNVLPERALEWTQYGRAACIDWNGLPDPSLKSSDQTAFRPL